MRCLHSFPTIASAHMHNGSLSSSHHSASTLPCLLIKPQPCITFIVRHVILRTVIHMNAHLSLRISARIRGSLLAGYSPPFSSSLMTSNSPSTVNTSATTPANPFAAIRAFSNAFLLPAATSNGGVCGPPLGTLPFSL